MPLVTDMLHNENVHPAPEWIRFAYRTSHPVLRFLPTKLAEFIGENYASELEIPPKTDWSKWNPAELNAILKHNLVTCRHGHGYLRTVNIWMFFPPGTVPGILQYL